MCIRDRPNADAAKKAARASRANALFSVPMLFFMVFTSHFAPAFGESDGELGGGRWVVWIIFLAIWVFAELNALGKLPGGLDSPFCKMVLDDHRKTIYAGIIFTAVMYFIGWELLIGTP